ncbi:MAG TPA: CHAP domain-containing protein, partial [Bacteroidia bacterium]|nr:CHAP domain-containing protein [Bacteroidia bacterium]
IGKRNVSTDGYNIGMQYQCVEFVKRYYYEYYHHKMPDSYGNAKDFFDNTLADGVYNGNRDLLQYRNSSKAKPQQGDLVIMDATRFNPYGHVAIVSNVTNNSVEIIQQNPGPAALSRVKYDLQYRKNLWRIDNARILGWLRVKTKN